MIIELVNGTQYGVTGESGVVGGGFTGTIQLAAASDLSTLAAQMTAENINTIKLYDGETLTGTYPNQKLLPGTIDWETLAVGINTRALTAEEIRIAALESRIADLEDVSDTLLMAGLEV